MKLKMQFFLYHPVFKAPRPFLRGQLSVSEGEPELDLDDLGSTKVLCNGFGRAQRVYASGGNKLTIGQAMTEDAAAFARLCKVRETELDNIIKLLAQPAYEVEAELANIIKLRSSSATNAGINTNNLSASSSRCLIS